MIGAKQKRKKTEDTGDHKNTCTATIVVLFENDLMLRMVCPQPTTATKRRETEYCRLYGAWEKRCAETRVYVRNVWYVAAVQSCDAPAIADFCWKEFPLATTATWNAPRQGIHVPRGVQFMWRRFSPGKNYENHITANKTRDLIRFSLPVISSYLVGYTRHTLGYPSTASGCYRRYDTRVCTRSSAEYIPD